tara:strand:+ start:437 stop:541 length:105 start_codon:yes stop_codon:yes gene_type:complete
MVVEATSVAARRLRPIRKMDVIIKILWLLALTIK